MLSFARQCPTPECRMGRNGKPTCSEMAFGRAGMRPGMLFRPACSAASSMHARCREDMVLRSSLCLFTAVLWPDDKLRSMLSMKDWSAKGLPNGCTCDSSNVS